MSNMPVLGLGWGHRGTRAPGGHDELCNRMDANSSTGHLGTTVQRGHDHEAREQTPILGQGPPLGLRPPRHRFTMSYDLQCIRNESNRNPHESHMMPLLRTLYKSFMNPIGVLSESCMNPIGFLWASSMNPSGTYRMPLCIFIAI